MLQHVSITRFFFIAAPDDYAIVHLSILLPMDHRRYCRVLPITNKAAEGIPAQRFLRLCVFTSCRSSPWSSGKYVFNFFREMAKTASKVAISLCTPTHAMGAFQFLHSPADVWHHWAFSDTSLSAECQDKLNLEEWGNTGSRGSRVADVTQAASPLSDMGGSLTVSTNRDHPPPHTPRVESQL